MNELTNDELSALLAEEMGWSWERDPENGRVVWAHPQEGGHSFPDPLKDDLAFAHLWKWAEEHGIVHGLEDRREYAIKILKARKRL